MVLKRISGKRVGNRQALESRSLDRLDGGHTGRIGEETGAVFEAKFMLPWSFSERGGGQKHMPQLRHNMLVVSTNKSVLSIITGGGRWVEILVAADPIYQTVMIYAERAFWQAVNKGSPPIRSLRAATRIEAVRAVDMSASNAGAEFASLFRKTRPAHLKHERAKAELKVLVPEDAKEAIGRGIRAKRSNRAQELRLLEVAGCHGPVNSVGARFSTSESPGRTHQSRKGAGGHIASGPRAAGTQLSLCFAGEWGLDIVRKTLGRHEIATIQTTAMDRDSGTIKLTTTLAHGSGEWIASDWPVCPLSDLSSPRRMGAALTYARRYALFTLVGIAGEDDLDAPDLPSQLNSATPIPSSPPLAPPLRGKYVKAPPRHVATLDPEASASRRDELNPRVRIDLFVRRRSRMG